MKFDYVRISLTREKYWYEIRDLRSVKFTVQQSCDFVLPACDMEQPQQNDINNNNNNNLNLPKKKKETI